jgi:large subunit ribosomal protein L24
MRSANRGPIKTITRIRLKRGDQVQVLAGEDRGKGPAEILRVLHETGHVIVKGVNMQTKHVRRSQEDPKGGVREQEGKVHASNVLMWSDKLKRGVRLRYEVRDGKKVRVGTCGTVFD